MKLGKIAVAIVSALFFSFTNSASATLIGDDVTLEITINGATFGSPITETVGAGVEFDFGSLIVDVSASRIDIVVTDGGGPLRANVDYILTDLDWVGEVGEIVNVVLNPNPGIGSVSFTEDSVTFSSFAGEPFVGGLLASIEIVTPHSSSVSVPEPGTLALLGLGLAGIAVARRKRAS
ncbi:PEP-CTERM sorting domain-containing protein [Pelagibius sp. Alg239-R121]|uniref:PEP-CTERM sorting domain-containing protein n=1 Tax=Pelagibius sp. Alg239-R121 TaxID=2993448 RepID=UPI0024A6F753|nr:PEP-CTERM sorting domain-containing protein [Pelagibius sp. Alg239-R121]